MTTLILGASGYVGSQLALADWGTPVVGLCAVPHSKLPAQAVDLGLAPLPTDHPLFKLTPQRVIVATSIRGNGFETSQHFVNNLKALLLQWGRSPKLERLDYLSSQRVHTGKSGQCSVDNLTDIRPMGADELYTLEAELFLQFFSQVWRPDVEVNIWRMPLLTGGHYVAGHRRLAPLDIFYGLHYQKFTWPLLSEEERQAGTSWLHIPDFVEKLKISDKKAGLRFFNPSSGDLLYSSLSELFQKRLRKTANAHLYPMRLRFFAQDNVGLPKRNFEESFDWSVLSIVDKFYR